MKDTEDDIETFRRQLGEIEMAVNSTENKIESIQAALDKVVECMKQGKPVDEFIPTDKATNETSKQDTEETKTDDSSHDQVQNSHEIFDRTRLLEVLKRQKLDKLKNPPRITVGMIGYPNVGKSSSVNVLMQTKKVISFLIIN